MRNQHVIEELASEISVSMQEGQLDRQTDRRLLSGSSGGADFIWDSVMLGKRPCCKSCRY